jgi:N-acetylglucosaminyldiphosphoundecaprenol N-acetyl-beta-D-mannosaminyltransferase
LGGEIHKRITGSDVMAGISERWNALPGRSFFFLGSSIEVLEKIKSRMTRTYPNIEVRGVYAPPFNKEFSAVENDRIIESVNRARPTVLWVGMTAPKQEKWVQQHRHRLNVPLIAAVGAVFDYVAGTKKRASAAAQSFGLEWLPRLFREPRRMWRRNVVSTPIFLHQKFFLSQSFVIDESMREQ